MLRVKRFLLTVRKRKWVKRVNVVRGALMITVLLLSIILLLQTSFIQKVMLSGNLGTKSSSQSKGRHSNFLRKEGDVCEMIGTTLGRETREIVFMGDSSALRSFKSTVDLTIQCGESFVRNASATPKLLRGVVRVSNGSLADFASWKHLKKAKDVKGVLSADVWHLALKKTKKGPPKLKPLLKLSYVPALYASDVTKKIRDVIRTEAMNVSVATNFVLMFGMWDLLRPREDIHGYSFSSAKVSADNITKMQLSMSRYMLRSVIPNLHKTFVEWCNGTKYLPNHCNPLVISDLILPNCSAPKFNKQPVATTSSISSSLADIDGNDMDGFDASEAKARRRVITTPKLLVLGGGKKKNGEMMFTGAPDTDGPDPYKFLQQDVCQRIVKDHLGTLYNNMLSRAVMSAPADIRNHTMQPILLQAPRIPKDCRIPDGVHPDLGPVTGDTTALTGASRKCRKAQSHYLWNALRQSIENGRAERCRTTNKKKCVRK